MTKPTSASKKYAIDAFFAGVGGIELGFTQTNQFEVKYANEFDKNARITYQLNHPSTNLDDRDVHEVSPNDIPDCDVIMGGFPCQAFSIAGFRKGFKDIRGNLFFEMLRMIEAKKPEIVFIENVKNLIGHADGKTFKVIREALVSNGYYLKWQVLNSKDYGNIPQNRERIYLIGFKHQATFDNFEFPKPIARTTNLHDIIDFNNAVDDKYYYKAGVQSFYPTLAKEMTSTQTVYQWRRQYVRENKSGVVPTLTANMGTGGHNVPLIRTNTKKIRKLTPKETFNAQGFPKDFKLPDNVSNGQLYKQAGNSVSVPVIHRIAEQITTALNKVNIHLPKPSFNNGEYALIYVNINGKFKGESYLINRFSSKQDAKKFADNNHYSIMSDNEYFKIVNKKQNASFYMIEKL